MSRRVGLQRAVKSAVILWGLQSASHALGLGLGEMEMRSFLNEPLQAEVELLDLRGLTADDIRIRLAGNEDFNRLGVERSYFLTAIRFEVDVSESGEGVIRLSTDQPVLEPYLDLIIEARWPTGRLLREYTVLVDPPTFRQEVVTVSASEEVAKTDAAQAAASAPPPASAEETAGGEVDLRRSDLPAGEMPDRAFAAQTTGQPSAGNRYMVKRDETLWQIASSGRPQGVSVQQAMLDIQRLNPEAFIDGNINRIKAGYIIYLPAAGEISSDDLADALEEVREQNQAFAAQRSQPGVTAAATLRVSAESGDSAATPGADDSRSDTSSAGAQAGGTDLAAAAAADATARAPAGDVASPELAAQLAAMADRLDTLEQIVSLKDEQIATLEQALREAREAAALANASAASAQAPVAPVAETVAEAVADAPVAEDSAPDTSPAPAAAPAPRPEPQPTGLLGGLPLWPLVGGVLALIALVVFALVRRRRSEAGDGALRSGAAAEDDVFAGVSLKKEALEPIDDPLEDAIDSAVAAAAIDELESDVEDELEGDTVSRDTRGYGERKHDDYIDEGSGGDALAEADIYIAYGRYLQAIELLNTAIKDEPENSAYRLKLIELYVDMGEGAEAEQQLERLRASGDSDAIARAESLVGGGHRPGDYDDSRFDEEEMPEAPETADSLDSADLEDADELDMDEAGAADDAGELSLESEYHDLPADADGIPEPVAELDEGFASIAPDAEDAAEEGDEHVAGEDDGDDAILELESTEETDEDVVLDFSDELPSDLRPGKGDDSDASAFASGAFDHDDSQEMIEFESLEIEHDGRDDTKRSDLDSDLDAGEELDLSEALTDADAEAPPENGNGEELMIAEDADQMATKLDLARAYLDMGDSDGAKGILEQVIAAGDGEQQQEAQELLSRID